MLRSLWATQYFTPMNVRMLLAKSYLLPTLTYGCEIYARCDSVHRQKLNVLFNNITRYVFGLHRMDHTSYFSIKIYDLPFDDHLKLRCLILLHKIIFTKEPSYLFERLTFTRSQRNNSIVVHSFRCLTSERQFFINSIRLWNGLPDSLQRIRNPLVFKTEALKYLRSLVVSR